MAHHARRGVLGRGAGGGGGTTSYYLAVGHDVSPYLTVYPWSASGFGAKFANPATLPAGYCFGVDMVSRSLPAGPR